MKLSAWTRWYRYLASLPNPDVAQFVPLQDDGTGWCDVFTDGSCRRSSDHLKRAASFAILVAGSSGGVDSATIVGQGLLPEVLQSAFQAELLALVISRSGQSHVVSKFGCGQIASLPYRAC